MSTTLTRRDALSICLSTAVLLDGRQGFAQNYPNQPLRILVGGAAGSVPDTLTRLVADRLSAPLGQPVLIENRPGAGGAIAINALLTAVPDGHTLAIATMSQAVFNSYLFSKLAYDPLRDLEPVAPLASGPMAIAANSALPVNTFAEFVALARSKPEAVLVGTPAVGSPPNVFTHLLIRAANIKVTLVPYTSGPDGMTGVMRGDVQIFVDAPTIIAPLVKAGKIKAIAVSGHARDDQLPETPTLAEAGLPAAETEARIGLVAPARTPKSVIQRLNREIGAILKDTDFRQRLAMLSFVPVIASPEEFRRVIEADHQRWGTVIRNAGIQLD
jgi:tripartite-type tricarboxylate transporter receptor subunit TctC